MKYKFTKIILLTAVVAGLTTACTRMEFPVGGY